MATPVEDANLTQLPGWESLPADVQRMFADVHLPASFLKRDATSANFVVGPDLVEVDAPPLGRVLRFARRIGGFGGDFCLNPATGAVVLAIPGVPPILVNSSLDLLARTIRLVLPFERQFTTGDADDCLSAAQRIRDAIERLDEAAAHPDNYWGSFTWDVEAGDYSDNDDF
jgi:hypothetical protein